MLVTPTSFLPEHPVGFIVLDGVNGAGKTTFQKKICDYLTQAGLACKPSREPGATKLGQSIRELVVEAKCGRHCRESEALLFSADRAQHVAEVIKPALSERIVVVVDRYYYSTLAFQGYGQGLNLDQLKVINEFAVDNVKPDLVLLFDLPVEQGLARTRQRQSAERDCYEQEELQFHERLRTGFRELAQTLDEPFAQIDASLDIENVWHQIKPYIDRLIASYKLLK